MARLEMTLEARLWREVGQHLELDESVRRIAAILADHVPIASLAVRRLDDDPLRLTTVAVGMADPHDDAPPWTTRSEVPGTLATELRAWIAHPELTEVEPGQPLGSVVLPAEATGRFVAVPLSDRGRPAAVALLAMRSDGPASPEDLALLAPLLGPLAVAFENDQRIHELARMREALEADREALLSRLGRQDISDVVIGESSGLRAVMERVEQVAPTDAPVLILGETGSGKEVIARAIHTRSRRAKGPVVRVNCGAIPAELIDSELFGHERGAFTGAVGMRKGWFERADGGTLFLDEIGELSPPAQVRLLRVLQDGTLERIGGTQTLTVDVRIVAATNRHLETMVAEGAFREDLWYRLCVFPIRLPALRERAEDIPLLAAHLADRAGKRLGGVGLAVAAADIALLRAYAWPGNVRELAAVIERAAILGNGKRLDIVTALGTGTPRPSTPSSAPSNGPIPTLDQAMAAHIERVLGACHGRIEGPFGAARVLDINPHTLRARMRKLGIRWSVFRAPLPS